MTREERIAAAFAEVDAECGYKVVRTGQWLRIVERIVDTLCPRKLKEIKVRCGAKATLEGSAYFVRGSMSWTYLNVLQLVAAGWAQDEDTLKALLALRDNPWEE